MAEQHGRSDQIVVGSTLPSFCATNSALLDALSLAAGAHAQAARAWALAIRTDDLILCSKLRSEAYTAKAAFREACRALNEHRASHGC